MNDADMSALRAKVLDEFARIAAYPDGSPDLAQFNQRLKSRILQTRRGLSKLVNSPPGFGFRGSARNGSCICTSSTGKPGSANP